jgi:hypothetical protein
VLLDQESLAYLAPIGGLVSSFGGIAPRLVEAYHAGTGIGYGDYGPYMRDGQGAFNRTAFMTALASEWLASGMPDLHQRLQSNPPASVLDVGCGHGWSSVALAAAYPKHSHCGHRS